MEDALSIFMMETSCVLSQTPYMTRELARSEEHVKSFDMDNVEPNDILDADEFSAQIVSPLEGYYCGQISNGRYKDDSGNAYFAKFFEDRIVRTLYAGTFQDGQFNDQSGDAWMIGKLEEGAPYSFYRGPFENGASSRDPRYWEKPVSINRIQELLNDFQVSIHVELKWTVGAPLQRQSTRNPWGCKVPRVFGVF